LWLREVHGREEGLPPAVNLAEEKRAGELVRELIARGSITAAHDISDGGMLVALAEMALAGNIGAFLDYNYFYSDVASFFFGEDQGRYLITAPSEFEAVRELAATAGVPFWYVGMTQGDSLRDDGDMAERRFRLNVELADLRRAHEGFFPNLMGADAALA
jgi:phosphoribosylformylglycinamidine synthase